MKMQADTTPSREESGSQLQPHTDQGRVTARTLPFFSLSDVFCILPSL